MTAPGVERRATAPAPATRPRRTLPSRTTRLRGLSGSSVSTEYPRRGRGGAAARLRDSSPRKIRVAAAASRLVSTPVSDDPSPRTILVVCRHGLSTSRPRRRAAACLRGMSTSRPRRRDSSPRMIRVAAAAAPRSREIFMSWPRRRRVKSRRDYDRSTRRRGRLLTSWEDPGVMGFWAAASPPRGGVDPRRRRFSTDFRPLRRDRLPSEYPRRAPRRRRDPPREDRGPTEYFLSIVGGRPRRSLSGRPSRCLPRARRSAARPRRCRAVRRRAGGRAKPAPKNGVDMKNQPSRRKLNSVWGNTPPAASRRPPLTRGAAGASRFFSRAR